MFHLFAVFAMGFVAAGCVLIAFKLRGVKPPRYMVPLAAGLAMIGYALWSDYSWAPRTIAALPERVAVVKEIPSTAVWKPWTYLVPQVDRFVAVDGAEIRRNPKLPNYVLAEVILVARQAPVITATQLFDCEQARRSDVVASAGFTDDGLPADPQWVTVETDDGLFRHVCKS